ncbi:HAD hydrolase family protein [Staphylococcus aureus]
MTNYKVVVLDMDDTLLNSDNVISEETANYLTAIQVKVVIVRIW